MATARKNAPVPADSPALLFVFLFMLLLMQWRVWPSSPMLSIFEAPPWAEGQFLADGGNGNETALIIAQLRENGTAPCHNVHTNFSTISGVRQESYDPAKQPLLLAPDAFHRLIITSHAADGTIKCAGGDYYETDLRSSNWISRPPVHDYGNGSYGVMLFVDSAFEGVYNFSVTLLFDAFHGLEFLTRPWDLRIQTVFLQISFFNVGSAVSSSSTASVDIIEIRSSPQKSTNLTRCRASKDGSFHKKKWQGRWTRKWVNETCTADKQGRFGACVPIDHQECSAPWCTGRVSRLESNEWVYSAHCSFHIFEAQEAWDCLSGRWLLFWGDSNFQDTIRNLMLFVLDVPVPYWSTMANFQLPRNFEEWFVNPKRPDQAVHVSMIFNGHYIVYEGDLGLDSLENSEYRDSIIGHFRGEKAVPDTVIMNSGLHDGAHFRNLESYSQGVDRAVSFWRSLLDSLPPSKRGKLLYRTTVAPAGESRGMQSNPQKMETYNKMMVEKLQAAIPSVQIVDAFDITFPFHYDNNHSDGGHYGRAPNVNKWPWFGQPHHYFVDLMLVHTLLNAICPT